MISHNIRERPEEANQRKEIGHWESDTVRGSRHSGSILTQVDCKSRYLIAAKIPDGRSETFMSATIAAMQGKPVKTFTADNGKEFAAHDLLTRAFGAEVYFCDPSPRGREGRMRTRTGCFSSSFQSDPALREYHKPMLIMLYGFSITGLENACIGTLPKKSFPANCCT